MANQNLLTIFLAVVSVAVLIQAGILVGFYIMTSKLTRQADRAISESQKLFGPMERVVETLSTLSARLAEFGASTQGRLHHLEAEAERAETSLRSALNRWSRRA
jgi:hypothetical protein